MGVIDSPYTGYKVGLTTLVLSVMVVVSLLLNGFLFFVYARSKLFRRPHNLFIINLAVADVFGALFWGIPAVIAASQWKWILGNGFCQFQGFAGIFSCSLNMYTLTAIAFEKFLKIFFPAKHADSFRNYTMTLMVIGALWIMSFVMSLLPIIGWGSYHFYTYLMQCDPDFVQNASHLHFYFTNVFCVPLVSALCLFLATFIKIALLKKNADPSSGKIVMQERKSAPKMSYAEKVRRQEEKFQFAGMKTKDYSAEKNKSKSKKSKKSKKSDKPGDDGYGSYGSQSDDSMHEISDDDLFFTDYEGFREYERDRAERRKRKRVFTFKRRYLSITIVMFINWLIFCGLWAPYFFVSYAWVFDSNSGSEELFTTVALVTFGGITYKPLVYLINGWIRKSVKQAFQKKKKTRKFLKPGSGDAAEEDVVYSVREVHHTEVYEESTFSNRPQTRGGTPGAYSNRGMAPSADDANKD